MKAYRWAPLLAAVSAAPAMANNVIWTLTGTPEVSAGQPVNWQAAVEVTGDNQGLAGYAFHIVVGTGSGATPGPDGQWGTGDDENLADVQLPQASFPAVFRVAGAAVNGSVKDTGAAGGPGMDVLPQAGTNTARWGELLQIGAGYIDWAAWPGSDGQTAGVGVASAKPNLLADPNGSYVLNAGTIPTAGLPGGTYTVTLVPVATRTLRSDLNFANDHQGFIMQSAPATGSSFTFTVTVPVIPGDFDDDTDVDEDDLLLLIACSTGPDVPYQPLNLPPGCTLSLIDGTYLEADFDLDGDVDQDDFAVYQRCFSGSGVTGDATCAD